MFFRFGSAIVLAVLVSMAGVAIETRILDLRREVSRQYFQTEVLLESHARLRLRTQQLAAPSRQIQSMESTVPDLERPTTPGPRETSRLPLLRWQAADPWADAPVR